MVVITTLPECGPNEQLEGEANRIGQKRAVFHAFYFLPRQSRGPRIEQIVSAKNRVRKRFLLTAPPSPCGDSESQQEIGFVTTPGLESSLLLIRERFEQGSRFRLLVPGHLESERGEGEHRDGNMGFSNIHRIPSLTVEKSFQSQPSTSPLPARLERDPARERLILAAGPLPSSDLHDPFKNPTGSDRIPD